jgi:hypothetical protein
MTFDLSCFSRAIDNNQEEHYLFTAKYLTKLLKPLGEFYEREAVPQRTVFGFLPTAPSLKFKPLGLLGQIASSPCLLLLRNPSNRREIRQCIQKLFLWHDNLPFYVPDNETLPEEEWPCLWILTQSVPKALWDFDPKPLPPDWHQGVYFLAEGLKTAVVVLDQLPTTPETLWIRILGKGDLRQQAINELIALPTKNALRNEVLGVIKERLRSTIYLSEIDKELRNNLSPILDEWPKNLSQSIRDKITQQVSLEKWYEIPRDLQIGLVDEVFSQLNVKPN